MKSFGVKLTPYLLGAALFWLLGWYQANFQAPEGDLFRTSFLIGTRHYPDPLPLSAARDSIVHDILLVGDSHLDPSPTSRRFQTHADLPVSSHSHWAYENFSDPFSLGVALSREQSPRLVIFEVVERNLIHFAHGFMQLDSLPEPRIASPHKHIEGGFSHLGNGVRSAASLLNIRHKWCQNDQCRILPCTKSPPLYYDNSIFLTKMVWERRKPPHEVLPVLNQLHQALSARLKPNGIDFIIYVIPDKATVYSDFFDSAGLHPSFLLDPSFTDRVQSPVFSMRKAVTAGTMEVFKYSDTHLAPAGAKIVGEHLNGVLKQWAENQPY